MSVHRNFIFLCMLAGLAVSASSHAEDVSHDGRAEKSEGERRWKDPLSPTSPSVESGDRSRDQRAELDTRLQRLKERIAIISEDLKAGRRRDGLEVRAKAALREADAIKAQAQLEQDDALKLTARAEALRVQITAITLDHDRSDEPTGLAVAPTRNLPAASADKAKSTVEVQGSSPGAKVGEGRNEKSNHYSLANRLPRRDTGRGRPIDHVHRASLRRALVLPNELRPIRF